MFKSVTTMGVLRRSKESKAPSAVDAVSTSYSQDRAARMSMSSTNGSSSTMVTALATESFVDMVPLISFWKRFRQGGKTFSTIVRPFGIATDGNSKYNSSARIAEYVGRNGPGRPIQNKEPLEMVIPADVVPANISQ